MKSCPSCQQVFPDDGPDYCTNDGTPLVRTMSDYGGGGSTAGGQWQQPPPGYPPPGGYPPYGYAAPYPQAAGGGGLATAAMWTGISTAGCIVFGIILIFAGAASYTTSYGSGYYSRGPSAAAGFGAILIFLAYIVGLTAIILGIVAASMASRNPAISKAKAIVGLCLGAIPYLFLIIGIITGLSFGRFR